MNRIYRLVWNHRINTPVVASEQARSKNPQRGAIHDRRLSHGSEKYLSSRNTAAPFALKIGAVVIASMFFGAPAWAYTVSGGFGYCGQSGGGLACGSPSSANILYGTALGYGSNAGGDQSTAIGYSNASGDGSIAIGSYDPYTGITPKATGINSIALGSGAQSTGTNSVAVGAGSSDSGQPDVVSVGNSGTGLFRTITNVAAGTSTNDAVNYGQLSPVITQQTTDENNISSLQSGQKTDQSNISNLQGQQTKDVSNISSLQTQQSTDEQNIASNTTTINAVVDGKAGVCTISDGALECSPDPTKPATASGNGAIAEGMNAKANGMGTIAEGMNASAQYAGSVAIGNGAQANADPTTAIGNNAVANGNNSVALGANTTANGNNSVALGQGSVANRANSVSVGNAATGLTRQITNVAPGTEPNDAVNLGQLQGAISTENGIAQRYADTVGAVDAAAAGAETTVAGLHGVNRVALGVGEYNGQSAFGVAYQRELSKNWAATLALSSNGTGNNTEVNGGVGFSW